MAHHELPAGHFHHMEPESAYHGAKLGMWVFLATEVHLFGGLFCCFALYRWRFLEEFDTFAQTLNWKLGALNTAVLLTSSYCMVRAVDAAQKGFNKKCQAWLAWTFLGGIGFFVVKSFEYHAKLIAHDPPIVPSTHVFYGLYYVMTALHALHVFVGLLLIAWVWHLSKKEKFSVAYYTPVEIVGLYWHLVDVIWIFLFPVLYLLGGIPSGGGSHG